MEQGLPDDGSEPPAPWAWTDQLVGLLGFRGRQDFF